MPERGHLCGWGEHLQLPLPAGVDRHVHGEAAGVVVRGVEPGPGQEGWCDPGDGEPHPSGQHICGIGWSVRAVCSLALGSPVPESSPQV